MNILRLDMHKELLEDYYFKMDIKKQKSVGKTESML